MYGFDGESKAKYDLKVTDLFYQLFQLFPLAHVINKKVMITPVAVGCLRIPALTLQGWVDVKTYYSPLFTSTLLNEQDLIHATGTSNDYSGLTVQKYFNPSTTNPESHHLKLSLTSDQPRISLTLTLLVKR